ncbi:MAG: Ig-like domain-containing protein [Longimicrobiales bacterium]
MPGAAAVLLGLASCDTTTGPDVGPPNSFAAAGDPWVGGLIGTTRDEALAVIVMDSAGNPVPGVRVSWSADGSDVAVAESVSTTGRDGIARMGIRFADSAGVDVVRFVIDGWDYARGYIVYSLPKNFDITVLGPGGGGDFAPDDVGISRLGYQGRI